MINFIEFGAFAVGKFITLLGVDLFGGQPLIFPTINQSDQISRRPAFFINVGGFYNLFQQAYLIIRIQNCEAGFQTDQFGVNAQDFSGDGVKGSEPG